MLALGDSGIFGCVLWLPKQERAPRTNRGAPTRFKRTKQPLETASHSIPHLNARATPLIHPRPPPQRARPLGAARDRASLQPRRHQQPEDRRHGGHRREFERGVQRLFALASRSPIWPLCCQRYRSLRAALSPAAAVTSSWDRPRARGRASTSASRPWRELFEGQNTPSTFLSLFSSLHAAAKRPQTHT